MPVLELNQSAQFAQHLQQAGSKAVFVDFFATWCQPCRRISPIFEQLSNTYTQAVFLKIDVDKLEDIAQAHGVTSMPTFMCFKDRVKKEEKRGADPQGLEDMVKRWAGPAGGGAEESSDPNMPKGQMNLNSMIDQTKCECLNESDDHHLSHALSEKGGFLESDVDEQLLMTIAFNQQVRLHSVIIQAEGTKAPKTVKLFVNLPNTPDFDGAEGMEPVQKLELTEDDMKEGNLINLKYVKFQNVHTVTVFMKDNQGGEETTQIDKLAFIGCPVSTTNMNDFKRVAGKKGESH